MVMNLAFIVVIVIINLDKDDGLNHVIIIVIIITV